MKLIVVGAGITGLAAAHRLLKLAAAAGAPLDLEVIDAADRAGGSIRTTRESTPLGEILVEWGADSFFTEKPWAEDLARRLDLGEQLVATRDDPRTRRALILHRGRLLPVPQGFHLLAPAEWPAFLASPLLSWRGKLRAACEPFVPRRINAGADDDESVGAFVRRRLGRECLDRLAQPLVGGIYTGSPDRLSLRATLPRFAALERDYGSVVRGLRATAGAERTASGARYGLFASFDAGMQTLTSALVRSIGPERLRLGVEAESLGRRNGGFALGLAGGGNVPADAVLLALPAAASARLLSSLDPELSALLGAIRMASSAIVTLAWAREDVPHPLDAFGFVVPQVEQRRILAATFSSVKFDGRSPPGVALMRAFLGGDLAPGALEAPDSTLVETACAELGAILGVRKPPIFSAVHRHPASMPQYEPGHLGRVEAICRAAAMHRGLGLAGNWLEGVGVPDSVHSGEVAGEAAAVALLENLNGREFTR